MKVVVAHNRYASTAPSGENTIVDAEIAQLEAAGVAVVPFLRSSDEIATLPLAQRAALPSSPIYNRRSQRTLADLLRAERPDILHLHNPYPLLSPAVIRTAHRHGVPVIQTVHNYRQVCASGLYFRDGGICHDCRGRRFGVPAIRHACYRGSRPQSAIMATALAVHRGTWRRVDRYLALTSAIAEHLRDYGIPGERIAVKPNAIPDPGPPPDSPGEGFLFAARLSPEKGLELLLRAWRSHPEGSLGRLRIAGDGPLRPLAESAAAERSDVAYLGALDASGVRAAIRSAACVVATPTWHDVLPTIVAEALANGRPVLGTRLGGIPYLLGTGPDGGDSDSDGGAHGDGGGGGDHSGGGGDHSGGGGDCDGRAPAGWAVEPTVEGVAAGLATAGAEAAKRGPDARRRYERHFRPDVLVQRLIGIYEEVTRR